MRLTRHLSNVNQIEPTGAFAFTAADGDPKTGELIEPLPWPSGRGVDTVIGRVEGLELGTPIELVARHVMPVAADRGGHR